MEGGGASDEASSYLDTVLAEAERLYDAGDFDGAVAVLEDNLAQARNAMALEPQGVLHAALGDLHRAHGGMEGALAQYEKAAAVLHEAGDTANEAGALLRCGDAQRALKRVGAATQSYSSAAALYVLLDDPRGAGHGEFLVAELAAGVHREIAEKHYTQAIELYREAAEREGAPADPAAVPDPVADPRAIDSARMLEAAERGLARVRMGHVRDADATPGVWTPPAVHPAPVAAQPADDGAAPRPADAPAPTPDPPRPAPLPVAILGVAVCGLILLAVQWSDDVPLLSMAGVVIGGAVALLVARRAHALSPYLGYGAAGVAWLLLLVSGARPILRQDAAKAASTKATAAAPPVVGHQIWTPDGQRLIFERQLIETVGDPRLNADVLQRYGDFERSQGERRRCLELWERSQARYRDAAAPALAGKVVLAMGDVHMRGQRPDPAHERFAFAVQLFTEARDNDGIALALRRRGEAEVALQRWSDAVASYNESLRLVRHQHDPRAEAIVLLRCATIEQTLGRVDRARELIYQAITLTSDIGPAHARAWLALADFEASAGQEAAALRAYERAATLAGAERDADLEARGVRHRARYDHQRGQLAIARGRYEVGIRLARAREAFVAEALTCIDAAALELEAGDILAARDLYARAEALFADIPRSAGAARVALGLGDLDADLGDVEGARSEYSRALDLAGQADHSGLQISALDRLTRLLAEREPETTEPYGERASALRAEAFGAADGTAPTVPGAA